MKEKINKNKINLSAVGNKADIYLYVDERGLKPVELYIESLQENEQKKIIRLFQLMIEQGEIRNKEKLKQLEKNIFEFKSEPHRVLCFILPGLKKKSFVLTNAFKKEKGKTPKTQIIKAKSIKQEILLIN
ncbi:MAG: type II toxin-antitoxin system RelE/ParE family toxin [Candidatus Cloacimonetes bacterium]|nr:type II toxin-antitoxin system RelE/ParE family toxin [Candidatus Cloacimonadota bacterium]